MSAETPSLLASHEVPEGVHIEIFDESRPYGYTNLFQVRLRVRVRFPGKVEPYEQSMERLGVFDADLPRVRAEMVAAFERNALPHLLRADFGERLSAFQARKRGVVIPFPIRP